MLLLHQIDDNTNNYLAKNITVIYDTKHIKSLLAVDINQQRNISILNDAHHRNIFYNLVSIIFIFISLTSLQRINV